MAEDTLTLTVDVKNFEEVKAALEAMDVENKRLRGVIERERDIQVTNSEEMMDETIITLCEESAARLREALK
jgi:hypothetical protein